MSSQTACPQLHSRATPLPDTMRRAPERGDRLFPRHGGGVLAAVGVLVGLAALAAFLAGRSAGDDEARTMAFATVAFAELALVFSLRSPVSAAWEAPRNLYLVGSVVLSRRSWSSPCIYLPNDPLSTVTLSTPPSSAS